MVSPVSRCASAPVYVCCPSNPTNGNHGKPNHTDHSGHNGISASSKYDEGCYGAKNDRKAYKKFYKQKAKHFGLAGTNNRLCRNEQRKEKLADRIEKIKCKPSNDKREKRLEHLELMQDRNNIRIDVLSCRKDFLEAKHAYRGV